MVAGLFASRHFDLSEVDEVLWIFGDFSLFLCEKRYEVLGHWTKQAQLHLEVCLEALQDWGQNTTKPHMEIFP